MNIQKMWIIAGYSKQALKYQKVLRVSKYKIELLNLKHGVITILKK